VDLSKGNKKILIADSMVHNMMKIQDLDVIFVRGETPNGFSDRFLNSEFDIGHHTVVGFLVGTNKLDYRYWSRGVSAENHAAQVMAEYRYMLQAFRSVNPKAFIVCFTVIPRPIDHKNTHLAVQSFNHLLKAECKRSRHGFAPIWKSFVEPLPKGPARPVTPSHQQLPPIVPKKALYTGGLLHLSSAGAEILRHRVSYNLSDNELARHCGLMQRAMWREEDRLDSYMFKAPRGLIPDKSQFKKTPSGAEQ
jgi:hypothetical protein